MILPLTCDVGTLPYATQEMPRQRDVQRCVTADFDGDARPDTAMVLQDNMAQKVVVWVRHGSGRWTPLSTHPDNAQSRAMSLSSWPHGDPSCGRVTEGTRDCGRPYASPPTAILVVSLAGRARYTWVWGYGSFVRVDVY